MEENPYKTTDSMQGLDDAGSNKPKYGALKKILIGLGIVMVLILLLFVWVGLKTSATYSKLEGKAEPLIEEVLNDQSPWNYETLKPHLSRMWLESVSDEQNEKLIRLFSKLGVLRSIEELNWRSCTSTATAKYGDIDRCDYVALAKYENGDANVFFGLVIEENSPKIIQLHINSDVFLE